MLEYRLIYFMVLEIIYIGIMLYAYFKQLPGKRAIYIYMAIFSFLVAGGMQVLQLHLFGLDHNDLFHLVSLVTVYLVYSAANSEKSAFNK